ncbi:uncharacterized protein TRIVIDRAFT_31831 [Trichoderma virens Gv29-8]|uniref:UbiA prenyltransferase n=1 Tax=Hypocrea virens (strain Gv29-8 / FGSC 10586) TaxID=413071 RepID=G9MK96_HYPVG|nr:uncharacterized protein TRIVIDRAFT_31831 [Trichoderma virens Gv29-8]EHK25880.1 hypothetical protein TRIVIDRAFT_31831 [Trichoderma virens Gv29-8]
MRFKHTGVSKVLLLSFSSNLQFELDVTIRLLQSNAAGFCFIFMGGLLSRAILLPLPIAETAVSIFNTFIAGFLCNYIFDIANQASSPHEDYINKPHRPIPSGLISINQAKIRWVLAWTLGPITTYFFFGIWATLHLLHFEVFIFVCYVWPRWNSWFMRNYFSSFSYFILARLLNQVLARQTAIWRMNISVDFIISCWFMATIHIQEFYDLEGDRKSNRKTLPMLVSSNGLKALRAGTSLFIVAFSSGILITGLRSMTQDHLMLPLCILQQISSCILGYRISASNSVEMDRSTYHVYYYPSILILLLSLVIVMR